MAQRRSGAAAGEKKESFASELGSCALNDPLEKSVEVSMASPSCVHYRLGGNSVFLNIPFVLFYVAGFRNSDRNNVCEGFFQLFFKKVLFIKLCVV